MMVDKWGMYTLIRRETRHPLQRKSGPPDLRILHAEPRLEPCSVGEGFLDRG